MKRRKGTQNLLVMKNPPHSYDASLNDPKNGCAIRQDEEGRVWVEIVVNGIFNWCVLEKNEIKKLGLVTT
jgi:hypothetical protein